MVGRRFPFLLGAGPIFRGELSVLGSVTHLADSPLDSPHLCGLFQADRMLDMGFEPEIAKILAQAEPTGAHGVLEILE